MESGDDFVENGITRARGSMVASYRHYVGLHVICCKWCMKSKVMLFGVSAVFFSFLDSVSVRSIVFDV